MRILSLFAILVVLTGNLHAAPLIEVVFPDSGPRTQRTPVFIRGQNLGVDMDDITELYVGGSSCLGTLMYDSPNSLSCVASRDANPVGNNQTLGGTAGPIWITTKSGGKSNDDLVFFFFDSCFLYTTSSDCINAGRYGSCKWCQYATKCIQTDDSCNEGCSTTSLKMTCGELAGIIVASFFLVLLLALSTAFVVFVNWPLFKRASSVVAHADTLSHRSQTSRKSKSAEQASNPGAGDDGEEEEEEEEQTPLLSDKFIRHQLAIESTHRKLAGNKASLTSF